MGDTSIVTPEELKRIGKEDFGLDLSRYNFKYLIQKHLDEGMPLRLPVPSLNKNLGRCYNQYGSIVFTNDENDLTWANAGGEVLERGEHPILGPWIKYYYKVDSGD